MQVELQQDGVRIERWPGSQGLGRFNGSRFANVADLPRDAFTQSADAALVIAYLSS